MATAPQPRDLLKPPTPDGMRRGLALAIIAHVLLIAALAFNMRWRATPPPAAEAELWSSVPRAAAPKAAAPEPPTPAPQVEQPPPPPPAPAPAPAPKPVPKPEPAPTPPQPDPQIAIEKARKEEQKKKQAEQEQAAKEQARRDEQKRLQAQREKDEADKAKAEKDKAAKAEQARHDEARVAALREQNLRRMLGQAGATGEPSATGTALRSSGPSASYAGRIKARIKPNIVFNDVVDGNPAATVEVRLAPDGTVVGNRLVKSSGSKSWDDAVLRAIDKAGVMPRDIDGSVPPLLEIRFTPQD